MEPTVNSTKPIRQLLTVFPFVLEIQSYKKSWNASPAVSANNEKPQARWMYHHSQTCRGQTSTALTIGPSACEAGGDTQNPHDAPHNSWSSHLESRRQTVRRSLENEGQGSKGTRDLPLTSIRDVAAQIQHGVQAPHAKWTLCSQCSEDAASHVRLLPKI